MSTTMLATTTAAEAKSTIPMMTGRSCWLIASIDGLAEAGQAEHGLGDDDAAEQGPHVDAELGDDRGQCAARSACRKMTRRSRMPLDRAVRT